MDKFSGRIFYHVCLQHYATGQVIGDPKKFNHWAFIGIVVKPTFGKS
ncbi:MAG: hypothetical protein ACRCR9_02475 [Chitinophagaceae bacterium]